MTKTDVRFELKEVACEIKHFEMKVKNYEIYDRYNELLNRQDYLYTEYVRLDTLEKAKLNSSNQGASL